MSLVHETAKAVLYDSHTRGQFWVPKSALGPDGYIQIEQNSDGSTTLTAPESWLNERGLI